MLAPSHSGAYICLRCQSHAAHRGALAVAFQNARFLSRSSRNLEQQQQQSSDGKKKLARKIYPHGKLRGKKGGEVRESSELLPVNALGKPAEIILLKDAHLDRAKEEEGGDNDTPKDLPLAPRKSSKKAILESVEKGSVAVDAASTIRSIEELRDTILKRKPENGDTITQEEHDKLVKVLSEGFRTVQLRHYATQKGSNLLIRTVRQSEKLPHSDWTPGVTPADEKHLILSGFVGRKNISKGKLARTIIERGWQLHTDSAMQVGEIDVYDAQSFMQARNEYGTLILDQIAEARHVRMQALTEKVLRITGDREAAMAALSDISQKCLTVLSEQLRLIPVKPAPRSEASGSKDTPSPSSSTEISNVISLAARNGISASDLDILRSTTGVMAKIIVSKKDNQPYLKLSGHSEGQMIDALRAVFSMSDLSTRSKDLITALSTPSNASRGPIPSGSALYYHDRGSEKHRTLRALRRSPTDTETGELPSPDIGSKLVDAAMANPLPDPLSSEKSPVWNSSDTSLTTRLGFIYGHTASSTTDLTFNSSGLFTPGLAHLSPLLSFLSNSSTSSDATRNTISFVFRHDLPTAEKTLRKLKRTTTQAKRVKDPMPEIRFEFQLGSKGQGNETSPVLDGVHALVKDHNYCVALPDKPIDFAVSEKGALTVNLEDLQAKTIFEPILEQMKSSIRGQSRLRAPSTLDIPIPRPWVTPAHVSQMPTYDAAPLKITHLKARYRFVGVEHRQAIPFVVDGQQATFTTVESGKLGPRYLELSVVEADTQPLKKSEEAQVRKAKLRSAFQTGLKLVELVDRAAKGKLGFKEAKRLESSAEDAGSVASSGEHELISTATSDGTPVEEHVEQQRSAASG